MAIWKKWHQDDAQKLLFTEGNMAVGVSQAEEYVKTKIEALEKDFLDSRGIRVLELEA